MTLVFLTFLCSPCIITRWNDQILSWLGNGNGKAINSTISVRTRARSLLFSSNPNSLLLSNWAPWKKRGKRWRDAKSIFQRRFHGRHRCRIVRSLTYNYARTAKNCTKKCDARAELLFCSLNLLLFWRSRCRRRRSFVRSLFTNQVRIWQNCRIFSFLKNKFTLNVTMSFTSARWLFLRVSVTQVSVSQYEDWLFSLAISISCLLS